MSGKEKIGLPTIHEAAKTGNLQVLRTLLENGISVDALDDEGNAPLMAAISSNQMWAMKLLIDQGADVNLVSKQYGSPLYRAAQRGNHQAVQLLLQKGAVVDAVRSDGATPLMAACSSGNSDSVRALLEANASIEAITEFGATPLSIAAQSGRSEICQMLIDAGAKLNSRRSDGTTPLFMAALKGDAATCRVLLASKAEVDAVDENGHTPLCAAAQNGFSDIVDLFLENGADIDHSSSTGATALFIAAQHGHKDVVQRLLDGGANVHKPSKTGATPLFIAAHSGHAEICTMLMDKGAKPSTSKENGASPLFVASQQGHADVIEAILKRAAKSVNTPRNDGATPLLAAAGQGHVEAVRILLKYNASVDSLFQGSTTALHVAAVAGHTEICGLLIDHHVSINAQRADGATALHLAAHRGFVDVARVLLAAGADATIKDNKGDYPLLAAARLGHTEVCKLLIKYGSEVNLDVIDKFVSKPELDFGFTLDNLRRRERQLKEELERVRNQEQKVLAKELNLSVAAPAEDDIQLRPRRQSADVPKQQLPREMLEPQFPIKQNATTETKQAPPLFQEASKTTKQGAAKEGRLAEFEKQMSQHVAQHKRAVNAEVRDRFARGVLLTSLRPVDLSAATAALPFRAMRSSTTREHRSHDKQKVSYKETADEINESIDMFEHPPASHPSPLEKVKKMHLTPYQRLEDLDDEEEENLPKPPPSLSSINFPPLTDESPKIIAQQAKERADKKMPHDYSSYKEAVLDSIHMEEVEGKTKRHASGRMQSVSPSETIPLLSELKRTTSQEDLFHPNPEYQEPLLASSQSPVQDSPHVALLVTPPAPREKMTRHYSPPKYQAPPRTDTLTPPERPMSPSRAHPAAEETVRTMHGEEPRPVTAPPRSVSKPTADSARDVPIVVGISKPQPMELSPSYGVEHLPVPRTNKTLMTSFFDSESRALRRREAARDYYLNVFGTEMKWGNALVAGAAIGGAIAYLAKAIRGSRV